MKGCIAMLLWEQMRELKRVSKQQPEKKFDDATKVPVIAPKPPRSQFDKRCAAKTKYGRQCRARIVEGSDFCSFHNPNMTKDQRRRNAAKGGRSNRNLSHVLDGYLRPLNNEEAVGQAMDRLYREVRLGKVTPDMGRVLLVILVRLLREGFAKPKDPKRDFKKTKAYRFGRKLDALLTEKEKNAWQRAVNKAPASFFRPGTREVQEQKRANPKSGKRRLQVAS
jgi:hypothetical protein